MSFRPFIASTILSAACLSGNQSTSFAAEPAAAVEKISISRETRSIEGWTVHIDKRLLSAPHRELGDKAIKLLGIRLADIITMVPPEAVEKIHSVHIWLDLNHGKLTSMQYHPSKQWLIDNGYAPELAKGVHITSAQGFVAPRHQQTQPWCVLHELAHAYHDQVLGFDNPEVMKVWNEYRASGRGDKVLYATGIRKRHYALNNQKEFFAEMTEAYFGTNDFFPFTHGELRDAEPATYDLMRSVWGPAPLSPNTQVSRPSQSTQSANQP